MTVDLYQTSLHYGAAYDELSADGVTPRPHWSHLMESLRTIGPGELGRRWSRAERRIRENGITYNIYSDPLGANRAWRIDIVPLLIAADEWRFIEAGIIQRAQLLSLLVEDLYGPQTLVEQGHFPASLLYANPAFLRPLVGVPVPAHSYLHMLAVDLARSPDGQWWVLADRTQAPSGSGYALENRTIVSDVLPDLFRTSNVLRLAPFFRAQREALTSLAQCDNPRIVLLTPGPLNETYFEHSYLARYLGFTLVEGADLTVRDRCVYLKTVDGLEQVHVILRRVDDSFCDPLELRSDSLLGVPGLVDAIVAGNVKVANALGSGVIETAAVMPFLPGLSRHLLGEELKLPSVATWWCGQEYALDWVLDHLDSVVVKPAFPSRGMEPVFGAELPHAEKRKFAEQLRAHPHEYVAQEQIALSTAPVWDNGHLNSRSVVLRTYVLNTGNGWVAIPGGLVRVAESAGSVVSMQRGGHSKDAWVLWDGPVDTFSMLHPRNEPVELRRVSRAVPSSVADNVFWLGRYAERAENIARLLRPMVSRVRRADEAELGCLLRLHSCLETRHSKLPKSKDRRPTSLELEHELISVMTDNKRPDSLSSTLTEVYRVGGNVRERLSSDMMHLLGQLRDSIKIEPDTPSLEYPAVLSVCLGLLSAFSGMERENINRGQGWLIMTLGRRLERAIYLTRQLREITTPLAEQDWPLLECLLEVADSSMTYRTRYYTTLQPLAVLDVLMADETNPRSLDFQLSHLVDLYQKLPRHLPEDLHAMKTALALLRSFDLRELNYPLPGAAAVAKGANGLSRLENFLKDLERLLPSWSNNLSNRYFSHARTLPIAMDQ
ncbi:circularly permuted type 2 ATP-grasp protein [Tunturiibacter lichenicola]|uniref:circularly permuted type 2 ATP-grasp protein n=1 Tax=Tunturiibacter lichenicola TaxID=2051959 RepID=UPI0021B35587|nr:circularly permuted type 2 ATP-grasp protein [Edaphobacter lichenicola]